MQKTLFQLDDCDLDRVSGGIDAGIWLPEPPIRIPLPRPIRPRPEPIIPHPRPIIVGPLLP